MILLPSNSNDVPDSVVLIFLIFDIPLLGFGASLIIRRLHDLGKSGWYGILVFFPIIMWIFLLWLLVKQGEEDNKYGPKQLNLRFPSDLLGK